MKSTLQKFDAITPICTVGLLPVPGVSACNDLLSFFQRGTSGSDWIGTSEGDSPV